MSEYQKVKISPQRIKELKNQVTDECLRRCKTGSVEKYGKGEYLFTTEPASKNKIDADYRNKITTPLNAINKTTITNIDSAKLKISDEDITTMEAFVTLLQKRNMGDQKNTDCSSSCTGLCYTSCVTTCNDGCKGECKGCGNACSSGCGTACGQGCAATCSTCNNCTEGCTTACKGNCAPTCATACIGQCTDSCTGGVDKTHYM